MTTAPSTTLSFPLSPEAKKAFEAEAARLHLTPSAYLVYLMERVKPGADAGRLDQMVNEVFGRFGPAMRKLAE